MPKYTQEELLKAVEEVLSGQGLGVTARRWGIPPSTIQDRIRGSTTHSKAAEQFQRLTKAQELHLCGWILTQDAIGNPPTHRQVRDLAIQILAAGGDDQPLGKNWMEGFIRRNPEIKTLQGKRLNFQRANGASTDVIKKFFQRLNIPAIKDIPATYRYNIDETGILMGQRGNGLVIGSSTKRLALRKQPSLQCWTTVIKYVSAAGQMLKPLVIFKGKNVQQQWFPEKLDQFDGWHFKASSQGWTDDQIAL